jgi:uncharacterized protein
VTRPFLGWGVGIRRPHFDSIFEEGDGIDCLEILTENFLAFGGRSRKVLERAARDFPLVFHGVSLSIGSVAPLDEQYLERLGTALATYKPHWFSDHLSYSSAFGAEYHELLPLPFTEEVVAHVAARVQRVKQLADIPFLLENPTYYVKFAGAEMTEAEFLTAVLERADCGLLLDVNNVWVNSQNHGYDPYALVDALPLDRVLQIHMAGHHRYDDVIIDTHGAHIVDPVFELYAHVLRRTGPVTTILEWDNDIPTLEVMCAENRSIRTVGERALGKSAA